jgi:hypothetical protein
MPMTEPMLIIAWTMTHVHDPGGGDADEEVVGARDHAG